MSLVETATRGGSFRGMGTRLLHRLIILMAYFIHRLGDTGHIEYLYRHCGKVAAYFTRVPSELTIYFQYYNLEKSTQRKDAQDFVLQINGLEIC
jgi:hypothetical protein